VEEFLGPDAFQLDVPSATRYAGQRRAPEDNPLPNALRAAAEMLDLASAVQECDGWTIDQTHMRLMGASGLAFDLWWPPLEAQLGRADHEQDLDIWADELVAAAASLGFGAKLLREEAPRFPEALGCLLNGWPVLAYGLPEPGAMALITGYEDSGHTLIGYVAQPGGRGIVFAPDQHRHLPGGLTKASALGLITDWREPDDEVEVVRRALARGLTLLRRVGAGAYVTNQALFAAWAETIETAEPDVVHQAALGDPLIWELAERRWYGSLYLKLAAELLPHSAGPLLAAADCFQAEHDLMYEFNRTAGGKHPGDAQPLLVDPETRPKLAAIVRQAAAKDAEAGQLLASVQQTL